MMRTFLFGVMITSLASAQLQLRSDEGRLSLTEGLAISGAGSWARRSINTDALVAAMVDEDGRKAFVPKHPEFAPPVAGDVLAGTEKAWTAVAANAEGAFVGLERGSYVLVRVTSETDRAMLLHAVGNSVVYVNGEPRTGDAYGHGFVKLPVPIRKGENVLVFGHAGRGGMRAELKDPDGATGIIEEDILYVGDGYVEAPDDQSKPSDQLAGVPIYNASDRPTPERVVPGKKFDLGRRASLWTGRIQPWFVAKVPVRLGIDGPARSGWSTKPANADPREISVGGREVQLKSRNETSGQSHTRTFISEIDGSVQYVSIVPTLPPPAQTAAPAIRPALVLSLHGASVEATSQAASYSAKPDMLIACPTNRRPFGFDWEDWGRIDALEALAFVQREYATDPDRVYLTGHSMGGHGTWQLGVLYPEQFAAIAPSAGWLSFDSYAGARSQGPDEAEDPHAKALRAARDSSDTQNYFENLRGRGVYIVHGDADDNVPVSEARAAREKLLAMGLKEGEDFGYHEQAGAGHWWDAPINGEDLPGAACVDWAPVFEMFRKHTLAAQNAARQNERGAGNQGAMVQSPLDARGFSKGSFKRAFDRRFVMIYGSAGTSEENAWALAKARFDADQWWYRANGYAYVLRDDDAEVESLVKNMSHNIILYGNADTNLAWKLLLPDTIRVSRESVTIDEQTWTGTDLGVLLAHGDGERTIGVIAGTGLEGCRAVDRLPIFLSGAGFPSQLVLRASVWVKGIEAVVRAE